MDICVSVGKAIPGGFIAWVSSILSSPILAHDLSSGLVYVNKPDQANQLVEWLKVRGYPNSKIVQN